MCRSRNVSLYVLITMIQTLLISSVTTRAFSQGAAVILPLSKAVVGTSTAIDFRIFNRVQSDLKLKITPKCDVDSQELEGDACLKFFRMNFDVDQKDSAITIKKGLHAKGSISLTTNEIKNYAFFKPQFNPEMNLPKINEGIRFVFNYQPGYLFIINPTLEKLPAPTVKIHKSDKSKIAQFYFDTTKLTSPQVVSISAKIKDKKTKKMLRFVRLASDKIVDPRRGDLRLDGEFAKLNHKGKICYDIIVQNHSVQQGIYKLNQCMK